MDKTTNRDGDILHQVLNSMSQTRMPENISTCVLTAGDFNEKMIINHITMRF